MPNPRVSLYRSMQLCSYSNLTSSSNSIYTSIIQIVQIIIINPIRTPRPISKSSPIVLQHRVSQPFTLQLDLPPVPALLSQSEIYSAHPSPRTFLGRHKRLQAHSIYTLPSSVFGFLCRHRYCNKRDLFAGLGTWPVGK